MSLFVGPSRHRILVSVGAQSDDDRYLLGQGIGSVVLPPYSESFGRKNLYVASTALYSISCAIVAAVPSLAGVVVGRFTSGLVSSIPTTVVVGSIEDMFNSKDRIWVICVWAIVANLGLIAGPILSTFITADLGWYGYPIHPTHVSWVWLTVVPGDGYFMWPRL